MAGYLSPAAYLYVEEQEYLQAYEDVLERYKGMWLPAPGRGAWQGPAGRSLPLLNQSHPCLGTSKQVSGPIWGRNRVFLDEIQYPQRWEGGGVGEGPETPLDGWWRGGEGFWFPRSTLRFLCLVEALKLYA